MSDQNDTETAPNQPSEMQLLKSRAAIMGIVFSNNIGVEALKAKIAAKSGEVASDENATGDDPEDQVDNDQDGIEDVVEQPHTEPQDTNNDGVVDESEQNNFQEKVVLAQAEQADPALIGSAPIPAPIPDPRPTPAPVSEPAPPTTPRPAPMEPPEVSRRLLTKAEQNMKIRKDLRDEQMKLIRLRITNMDPKKADLQGEIFTVANEYLGTVRKFIPYGEVTDGGYHVPYWIYQQMLERKFQMIRTVKDQRTGSLRPESRWMNEFALEVLPPLTQDELDRLATAQAAAGSMDEFA